MSDSKKSRVESSRDPDAWLRWFEEISSGEESPLDEDEEEENQNIVERSDHETDSELEGISDENESLSESDGEEIGSPKFYIGKDKTTRWRKTCGNTQVRLRAHNIIKHLPGSKREARNAMSEIDCIKLFVSDAVIQILVSSTNIYIEKIKNKFDRERDARLTNENEVKALIGILFLIGTLRSSRKNAHKIWDNSKGNGVEACYLAMSEKRFRFLIRCLRFDNVRTRNERRELDKLAPIRELFEVFLADFQNKKVLRSQFIEKFAWELIKPQIETSSPYQ